MSDVERRIEQWREGLAGSELLDSSDVRELESHLREEMEHLKTSGLSNEEAFLVARRRLGDAAALEEEFAKVNPHRRLSSRLSWMASGVLAYFILFKLSECATYTSTLIGRTFGLRYPYLALLACAVHVLTFVGIGVLVWRCHIPESPSQAPRSRTQIRIHAALSGLFAACWVVAVWWLADLYRLVLSRTMPMHDFGELMQAQMWASFVWSMLMPFLAAGLIVWLAAGDHRRAEFR